MGDCCWLLPSLPQPGSGLMSKPGREAQGARWGVFSGPPGILGKKGPQGNEGLCPREVRPSEGIPCLLGQERFLRGREGRASEGEGGRRREEGGGSSGIRRAHCRRTGAGDPALGPVK